MVKLLNLFGKKRKEVVHALLLSWLVLAIGCQANDTEAHIFRARTLQEKNDLNGALDEYYAALKQDPKQTDAIIGIGQVFEQQEKLVQALEQYRSVLRIKPRHVAAHLYVGNAYKRLGQKDKAIEWVKKAIELSPGQGWIYHLLAGLEKDVGNLTDAERCYKTAVTFEPNDLEFRNDFGKFLEEAGRPIEALEQYRQALALVQGLPKHRDEVQRLRQKILQLERFVDNGN